MRIAQISTFYDSHCGGLEVVAAALARGFSSRKHETVWLASDETPPPTSLQNLTILPYRSKDYGRAVGVPLLFPSLSAICKIDAAIAASDAVVVHDTLYLPVIVAHLSAKRHRKPILVVQHLGNVSFQNIILRCAMYLANKVITRRLLAFADQVVFISHTSAAYFADLSFKAPPDIVFNGVDTAIYHPLDRSQSEERDRAGLPQRTPIVLFVGRFVEKKGLAILREVSQLAPDITFVFAGTGPLDPRHWNLPNVIVIEGLTGAAIANLYRAADALVLPSQGEGYPLVVQEALACGTPVVCSDSIAAADPEARNYLCPVLLDDNRFVTAERIDRMLRDAIANNSPQLRAARVCFAAGRYSWDQTMERLLGHLMRIGCTTEKSVLAAELTR